jgi:peptidoglycan/LPS O-acetylase OafA/YrhL
MRTKIVNAIALTVSAYAFAAWVYVAAVALVLPQTLPWQLTHFAKWPRTDTFGEISFVVSLVAFFVYRMTKADFPRRTTPSADASETAG